MTNRQAAVIASRALAAWLIYQAVLDLGAIPSLILAFHMNSAMAHSVDGYAMRHQMDRILLGPALAGVFRLAVNISAALIFYNAGSIVVRFLTAGAASTDSAETPA